MTGALVLFIGGVAVLGLVLVGRWMDVRAWRLSLRAYVLRPPGGLSVEMVNAWLGMVAASTRRQPIVIELTASRKGITFHLFVPEPLEASVLGQLRTALPGVRLEAAPEHQWIYDNARAACELRFTNLARPLGDDRAEATVAAVLSSLQPLNVADVVRVQWILAGAPAWLPRTDVPAELARAQKAKYREPLLKLTGRVSVAADGIARANALLTSVVQGYRILDNPGVAIVRRLLPSALVAKRSNNRAVPLTAWPCYANTRETVELISLPLGELFVPGLSLGAARQLPPAPHQPSRGTVVAFSNFPGMQHRPLALTTEDRTRHCYIVGPSGSGKSVLLTRLILQDIQAGYGVIAIDPKGDLVPDVLSRLDDKAAERVLVVDASQRDMPIGYNPLGQARTEEERELACDSILHIFKTIWSDSWGPRSDQILRAALTTLSRVRTPDGAAMTLCEIVPLLTQPTFRRFVISHGQLPEYLLAYWQRFESLSEGERTQAVLPLINKLTAFTERTPIRLMLGQASGGLDFNAVFRQRRVVLISLAEGQLGPEAAPLLGSLLVFGMWQAALRRVNVPAEKRFPVFAHLDEMQTLVKLPVPLPDMLAQARGFKFGLTLANQYFSQLPKPVQAAVLGTVRTQISFAVEPEDAALLAKRFAPLTADELQGLAAFEVAMRPCIGAQTLSPVTGRTLPLDEPPRDGKELAEQSRSHHGVPREEVEAALQARAALGQASVTGIGRARRGGAE